MQKRSVGDPLALAQAPKMLTAPTAWSTKFARYDRAPSTTDRLDLVSTLMVDGFVVPLAPYLLLPAPA